MRARNVFAAFMEALRSVRKIAANGNKSALRIVHHRIRKEWFAPPDDFDQRFGVETRLAVWRKRLTGRPDSADYEAVNPNLFARAMIHVPRDAFIDLGCGKGRALILAYQAGFRDLIGVEISPSLARAALRNTRKLGIAASIVESDVADFDLPDRDLVAFMYNPFGPPTMQAVLEKLRSHRHSIHLIYINPQHGSLFADLQQLYADGAVIVLSNCVKSDHVQLPTGA